MSIHNSSEILNNTQDNPHIPRPNNKNGFGLGSMTPSVMSLKKVKNKVSRRKENFISHRKKNRSNSIILEKSFRRSSIGFDEIKSIELRLIEMKEGLIKLKNVLLIRK